MISYKIFILFLMLLMHYIEDFHLQGCLANLKQKKWWEKEVAEVQPVALQLLGERSTQPRPRCAFPQALAWCAWRDLASDAK